MKEPYGEGLASHTGPESCANNRKVGREALTRVQAGGVSSREIFINQRADAVHDGGRQQRWVRNREHSSDSARSKRSEEHTSELQSHSDLVCRLLLEKKQNRKMPVYH